MPDYTSILRRSIVALPDASPAMREAVYQRARAALARQLTAVDPPLSTREIERQHQELEDAVARLEADYSADVEDEAEGPPEPPPADDYAEPEQGAAYAEDEAEAAEALARDGGDLADSEDEIDEEDLEDDEDYAEEESSRTPLLIGLLLLVGVLVGVGAYGYIERDRLLGLFASADAEPPVTTIEPPPPAEVIEPAGEDVAATDKRPDRMVNGTEAPADAPPPADVATAEPLPGEEPAPEMVPEPDAPPEGEAELPGAAPEETAPPAEETQTAALPGESLVAQRAIFYFQGKEGSPGRATEGSVTWAEITRDNRPAIQALLKVSEQEVTTTVTIYKNNDGSLPASHLVEIQFSGEIGQSPIQRVPALVLKQTEQARGQPLTGAAVPVTNELFWIALSDDQEQVSRNIQLLREGSWFDIPILFNDGTRALLTFEKGIPGDKVFETVMATWTPS
jgi:hypothetical protein